MAKDDLWVFAYGSLLWKPGFAFAEQRRARLPGYRRRFCMTSIHYRGTPERPGLVLALDAADGLDCTGLAYRVAEASAAGVIAYLRARELVSSAYREVRLPVTLDGGERVEALAYVTDPAHPQYCELTLDEQAAVIAAACGPMGPNADYLLRTVERLAALQLEDAELAALAALVRGRS